MEEGETEKAEKTRGKRGAAMQGKTQFTSEEFEDIKGLVHELRRADRDGQKTIRGKMRRIGFYITDFSGPGFTTGDLDDLVTSGRIKIIDQPG